jgi:glycosyltransferase involved in cell wall biosynthesis
VCLPSYYREGLPKALLEAAAAGCAVVTTDSTGCREAIVPGITGDLVPAKSPRVLAEVINGLMLDPARRERYGRAGRERAIQQFSIEIVVEHVMNLYAELIARADAGR